MEGSKGGFECLARAERFGLEVATLGQSVSLFRFPISLALFRTKPTKFVDSVKVPNGLSLAASTAPTLDFGHAFTSV